MYLDATRAIDDMLVRNDAVGRNKKSAAPRQGVAVGIKCFDSYGRRFYAFYEIRQKVLRGSNCDNRKEKCENSQDFDETIEHLKPKRDQPTNYMRFGRSEQTFLSFTRRHSRMFPAEVDAVRRIYCCRTVNPCPTGNKI